MTAPQKEHPYALQEYIITEHELFLYESNGFWDRSERRDISALIRSRPTPSPQSNSGLYGITLDEIGSIIDLTENSCFEEDREKQVTIARERIDLINEIKGRGTVPETTPLISFGKEAFELQKTTIRNATLDEGDATDKIKGVGEATILVIK